MRENLKNCFKNNIIFKNREILRKILDNIRGFLKFWLNFQIISGKIWKSVVKILSENVELKIRGKFEKISDRHLIFGDYK